MFKQYIKVLYISLLIGFIGIAIFNVLIDPFALFDVYHHFFNKEKPALQNNLRAYKIYELSKLKPQALIVGSSRAQIGLSSSHPAFKYPTLNAGLPLATIDEMWDYIVFAHSLAPLKQIVLAVDFFSFNIYLKSSSPFRKNQDEKINIDPFSYHDKLAALIGWSGLKGSIQTAVYNSRSPSPKDRGEIIHRNPVNKTTFEKSERFYLERKVYLPYPEKKYSLYHQQKKYSSLQYYQNILELCRENQIECHIIILPVHARQLALIDALGLWEEFEHWKKALVEISSNFALYDFTGFSAIHTEAIPEKNEYSQQMQWFIDSAHITPQLGNLILDWVLLNKKDMQIADCEVKLSSSNIDDHLAHIREQKALFQTATPEVIAEMRNIVEKYENIRS